MTDILRMGADRIAALCFAGMIGFSLPAVASAAVINRGVEGPPLSEIRPAPKSIYPDQQVITAQPSPSEVDPAFLGPVLLMKSAVVDLEAGTATLPLRKGRLESGELVWSIMTDTTDPNLANLHGVDHSPKLAYAVTGKAAREARIDKDGIIVFKSGKVDFSPARSITPGEAPNFFPPRAAQPGSVGDADYSPLVQFANGKDALFNMPMVAFNVSEDDLNKMCDGNVDHSKVEDKVVKICPRDGTVTLEIDPRLHLWKADLLSVYGGQRPGRRHARRGNLRARSQGRAVRARGRFAWGSRRAHLRVRERTDGC